MASSLRDRIENNLTLTILGCVLAGFTAGLAVVPSVNSMEGRITVEEREYTELEEIRDSRELTNDDKKIVNEILTLFERRAFTNDDYDAYHIERIGLMFKGINEARIGIQTRRRQINNRVYAKLIETIYEDLEKLLALCPYQLDDLPNLDDQMDTNRDMEQIEKWRTGGGKQIAEQMVTEREELSSVNDIDFTTIHREVRKRQKPLMGLIEAIDRLHKNGILDAA